MYQLRSCAAAACISLSILLSLPGHAQEALPKGPKSPEDLPLEELRMFAEVFGRIKSAYVEPIDDKQLLEDAIRGMVAGLDPHSSYLAPEDYAVLQEHTTGQFGGLGIEVGIKDGLIHVIAPIDDTPAQQAGLKSGDIISRIDNKSVQGLSLGEAVDLMRGEIGSTTKLTIYREGQKTPLEFELTRAVIKVTSVKSRLLAEGYGYVRISQFQVNTGSDLNAAIKKLQSDTPLRGVVLDLRDNPGGVLQAAVDVSDAFVDEGLIVYTEGRLDRSEMKFTAHQAMFLDKTVPLIVLINGGSASASEIVAGALQDLDRAVIMGTESFGKGSVQTILPLAGDRAVKITTARYFTPSGRSIQAQGIVPDIEVKNRSLGTLGDTGNLVKEADLEGHLENGNQSAKVSSAADLGDDFQLYQAYSLLKALSIVSAKAK